MEPLTLKQASGIVDAALEKAREINCKPMTVAVLDVGGHLLSRWQQHYAAADRPCKDLGRSGNGNWGPRPCGAN
jgi:uncharacterized protein GlcG (DUF336 family)